MIQYSTIRSTILEGLNSHTSHLAILAEQSEKKPPLPYINIKFTRLIGNDSMSPSEYISESAEGVDVREVTNPEMNLSVTCYGESDDDSIDLALQAYAWFKSIGTQQLEAQDIVVVSVESIQNRDSLIGGIVYERKMGFDVRLRVQGLITYQMQDFRHVQINQY